MTVNSGLAVGADPLEVVYAKRPNVLVCFDISIRKGSADALAQSLCSPPALPTGTPVHLDFLGLDHNFRITEIR